MTNRIVIVDADYDVRMLLNDSLNAEGYEVRPLATGVGVEDLLDEEPWDLVLIDIDLPETDGLALTRRIRGRFDVGIIIVSGRSDLHDRVAGLEVGADDYVVKPFDLEEVFARIRSVLRRKNARPQAHTDSRNIEWIVFDGWRLNTFARSLRDAAGHTVALTEGEYRLLETLALHPGETLSRTQLAEHLYEGNPPAVDRNIDVCIMRLRKKLGDGIERSRLIKTVRTEGYMFIAQVAIGTGRPRA